MGVKNEVMFVKCLPLQHVLSSLLCASSVSDGSSPRVYTPVFVVEYRLTTYIVNTETKIVT
jgi:hypothetical protein